MLSVYSADLVCVRARLRCSLVLELPRCKCSIDCLLMQPVLVRARYSCQPAVDLEQPYHPSFLQYKHEVGSLQSKLSGLTREELQRALGVKPMDKSSKYRGVSKKKGRWEAKVMLNRKWAYRCGTPAPAAPAIACCCLHDLDTTTSFHMAV